MLNDRVLAVERVFWKSAFRKQVSIWTILVMLSSLWAASLTITVLWPYWGFLCFTQPRTASENPSLVGIGGIKFAWASHLATISRIFSKLKVLRPIAPLINAPVQFFLHSCSLTIIIKMRMFRRYQEYLFIVQNWFLLEEFAKWNLSRESVSDADFLLIWNKNENFNLLADCC